VRDTLAQNSLVNNKYLETIKAVDGKIYNLSYHQRRLDSVTNSLPINPIYNLESILNPPKRGIYRCRVVYDTNNINVEYFEYIKRNIKSLKLIYDDYIEYEKKYENRDKINELFNKKSNADEILIVKNSLITDTSIANVAFFDGTRWLTPKVPLLNGTTRQRLLDSGKLVEQDIKVEDLKHYHKVALMNAMIDFDIIATDNIEEVFC